MFYSIWIDLARCYFLRFRIYLRLFPHSRFDISLGTGIWCMLGQGYRRTICLQVPGYSYVFLGGGVGVIAGCCWAV
ncbi:hypothetical protein BDV11DRAFT_136616 [Aspergillus similis]